MRSISRLVVVAMFLMVLAPMVIADVAIPTTTTVYFEMDGEPYENPIDYEVKCYGYTYDPGTGDPPEGYDPENPDLVYSYQASCPEYGCTIDEGYYINYREIEYCDAEGRTEGMEFKINKYADIPIPADCEQVGFERACTQTFVIPELVESINLFLDVSYGDDYFDAIDYVKGEAIVEGYEDATYKPEKEIKRAEFTKIIIESTFDDTEIENCTPTKEYPDIPTDEWYEKYVCVATNNDIIEGYPDGEFKGINEINFVEAAKIITLGFGFEIGTVEGEWYVPYVELMESKNAIPIDINAVDKLVTRGEMAEMIYRLKENITDQPSSTLL